MSDPRRTRRPRLATRGAALLATLLAVGAEARAQTIFTDRAAFEAAFAGNTVTNTLNGFDVSAGGLNPVTGISFAPITTGTLSAPVPGTAELNFANLADGVAWIVADGGVAEFSLTTPVFGIGASFFDLGTNGEVVFRLFSGGNLLAEAMLSQLPGFTGTGFLGLASPVAFDAGEIVAVAGEFYELDDPIVGTLAPSRVPEPATVLLLAVGGLALAGWRAAGARRRRA